MGSVSSAGYMSELLKEQKNIPFGDKESPAKQGQISSAGEYEKEKRKR